MARLFTQLLMALISTASVISWAAEPVEYNRDVRPLLTKNCFSCHGRDEKAREGDLRLDVRADAIAAKAFTPGNAATSELIKRIESNDRDEQMPPPDSGHALTKADRQTLKNWIASGAGYQPHWSFILPRKVALPTITKPDWTQTPIDHFVLKTLEQKGMVPSPPAERVRWLRRVSLDLTGLPPTIEEADAFLRDESNDALETVVDRLLNSPAYGEHWARMWLDLARYADTKGYEKDRHRDIWRYRDWVIDALNRDMPYDQFTIEQLAGDLLPDRTADEILATAFHRNTMTNDEGGTDNEEFRVAAVKDRVDTTMQVWMGLTFGCAKCHTHKYDPISIKDYYAFYALFNQTQDADNEGPYWPTPTPDQAGQIQELNQQIAQLQATPVAPDAAAKLKQAQAELGRINKQVPKTPVMLELAANKRRVTKVHSRGNFLDPADVVTPAVPTAFGSLPTDAEVNRHGAAMWLMDEANPLTSRVMVNRVWARLFGIGLVETEEDFGTQGLAPSHPELLDWLAVDFREQGWSLKKLLRSIVLSNTYRQSSAATPEKIAKDPQNRLLGRGPRFRLSAESVRDQALAVSGLLTRNVGGPSVMPPQPGGVWKSTYSGERWKNAVGPDRYRRGLYTYLKRTSPYPAMVTFDAGSGEVCQIRRVRTNTPLQALVTLNDTVFIEAAGALATQMIVAGVTFELSAKHGYRHMMVPVKSVEDSIAHGFRRVLIREPLPEELKRLTTLYHAIDAEFEDRDAFLKAAGVKHDDAAMVAVASVLLNLDETLMKP